jgi:putative copper resistance protein D
MPDQLAIAVRFLLYVALLVPLGLAGFALYGGPSDSGDPFASQNLRRWLAAAAGLGIFVSACNLVLTAANMAGIPLAQIDLASLSYVLTSTAFGTATLVRCVALLIATGAVLWVRPERAARILVALGFAIGTASLAWNGHAAMDEGAGGWFHLAADIVHLLAAGLWAGALLGFVILLVRPLNGQDPAHLKLTHASLTRFSLTGTILVVAIAASGLVNTAYLVGLTNLPAAVATLYGRLLLAKLALFAAMLALAATNRFALTPALALSLGSGHYRPAIARLRRSIFFETGSAVTVLAIVAWLGTIEPPISAG